jgi:hypothetical protein
LDEKVNNIKILTKELIKTLWNNKN